MDTYKINIKTGLKLYNQKLTKYIQLSQNTLLKAISTIKIIRADTAGFLRVCF